MHPWCAIFASFSPSGLFGWGTTYILDVVVYDPLNFFVRIFLPIMGFCFSNIFKIPAFFQLRQLWNIGFWRKPKTDRVISKDALTIATKSAEINGFLYRYAKQKRIWPIQTRSCHFQRCFDYRDQIISKDSWTQSSRSWSDINYYQCAQPWNIHETGLKLGWSSRVRFLKNPCLAAKTARVRNVHF